MWYTPRFPGRIFVSPGDRGPTGSRLSPHRRRSAVFRLERLEDRTVLSTFTVSNLADSGPDSLRDAIETANANPGPDVINFASNLHGTITLTSGELAITDDLTISGPGANKLTISGNDSSRVFDIIDINPSNPQTKVTIAGLTIAHGLANKDAPVIHDAGGGILNQDDCDLTLNNVVVSDNQAVGDASVTRSFDGYNITGYGSGGGVFNLGTLNVTCSTFTANKALGGDWSTGPYLPGNTFPGIGIGGGLYNFVGGTATVTDSRFADNLAQGGIHCEGTSAGLGQSGAIYNAASLTITGSSFRDNQAVGGHDNLSDINGGNGVGVGISSGNFTLLALPPNGTADASLTITGSSFRDNQAVGGHDNSVLPGVPPNPSYGPVDGSGGGIFVFQGDATILQTTLDHNQARGGAGGGDQDGSIGVGGGITIVNFIGGVTATIKDSAIVHNEAIGGPGSSGGRGGDAQGGGLSAGGLPTPLSQPGTVTVINTQVTDNLAQAGDSAAGSFGQGGGLYNDADVVTISNSRIGHNRAVMGGGISNSGTLKLDHDVLSDNQAVGAEGASPGNFKGGALGGAIETFGSLTVTTCQFMNNQALGANGISGPAAGFAGGGAIHIFGTATPTVTITDSLFASNMARGGNDCDSSISLTGALVGSGDGGAILNGGILNVTSSAFRNNQAIGGNDNTGSVFIGLGTGGAIGSGGPNASVNLTLSVSKSTFDHNLAVGGNRNQGTTNLLLFGPNPAGGGAIQIVEGSDNRISESTFEHNKAIGGQGAAGSNGGFGAGGGILVFPLQPASATSPTVIGVTVIDSSVDYNDASGGPGGSGGNGGDGVGGGIANLENLFNLSHYLRSALTVSNTAVEHNNARGGNGVNGGNGFGGGLYNGDGTGPPDDNPLSTLALTGARVQYNSAIGGTGSGGSDSVGEGNGGGVYTLGAFNFDLTTVIRKNHASTSNDDIGP